MPVSRGQRRIAWILGGLVAVVGLAWVMLLPMRQAPYTVESHELVVDGPDGAGIEGRLRNRGEPVPALLLEAYLYDDSNRYLGTIQTALHDVPGGSTVPFRIPLDGRAAPHVGRYSLYAGTSPNPFAPDR